MAATSLAPRAFSGILLTLDLTPKIWTPGSLLISEIGVGRRERPDKATRQGQQEDHREGGKEEGGKVLADMIDHSKYARVQKRCIFLLDI